MVIIITGATHTGKTILAQRLLEKYKYTYISIDLIKMGLIKSGNTNLTPLEDEKLTDYLWPIIKEMIVTAIQNKQNVIFEGCYIPYTWRESIENIYLKDIKFICIALSDDYIDNHYDDIIRYSNIIEKRLDDSHLTIDYLKEENRKYILGFSRENVGIVKEDYEKIIKKLIKSIDL